MLIAALFPQATSSFQCHRSALAEAAEPRKRFAKDVCCIVASLRASSSLLAANRMQLRWTVHSDLNRLPTAGRLWSAYVAPRISVDCYRPIAAAGRRAGCAGS
jgi:hypothetical protein